MERRRTNGGSVTRSGDPLVGVHSDRRAYISHRRPPALCRAVVLQQEEGRTAADQGQSLFDTRQVAQVRMLLWGKGWRYMEGDDYFYEDQC